MCPFYKKITWYTLSYKVSEMDVEYFPPKEDVILQNETPTDLYILISGAVVSETYWYSSNALSLYPKVYTCLTFWFEIDLWWQILIEHIDGHDQVCSFYSSKIITDRTLKNYNMNPNTHVLTGT